jgi:5-formyltetrahydrofolate cyclo-ligase
MKKPFAGTATKAALRADAMARRDMMPSDERVAASSAIARKAIDLVAPLKAGVIAVYRAIRTEVVPDPIVDWAIAAGLVVVLPAVRDAATLVFRRYRPGDPLAAGGFGTFSPPPDVPELDPDVVVSPMVAFDRTGVRLGHGRGYYDRGVWSLRSKGLNPALVGLAFAVQEVAGIPSEAHDIRMDWIVTETETIDFRHLG